MTPRVPLPLLLAVTVTACGSTPQHVAPGAPPTPASITMEHPGGDAADPDEAALLRQVHERWGFQEDKDAQLRIPLVDWQNYERVRYWAIDHFVGFKYGSDFNALNSVFILDVKDGPIDSDSCFVRAEKWAHPQIKSFDIKLGEQRMSEARWRGTTVRVMSVDGYLDWGLERRKFSAAYAVYPAYEDACLVFGFAVPWGEHEDLAKQVRDRWAKEGVPRLVPLTKTRPYRKD
ncbi:MAG TPA: hypothetical protein VHE30_23950 [Polyangiaceae bacterium]|nr:hypothetical protein [Polyangiaceae bacterium]